MILWSLVGTVALGTVGGGWYANEYVHENLASKESMQIAGAQVNYILTRQESAIVREIAVLEREQARRGNLTPTQRDRLEQLRQELRELREVRKGK